MATRIGVDVGGTFTDLLFYDDESGDIQVAKVPSTPLSPERGIGRALEAAVPEERLAASRYFLHGTTVGLNAILERRGAVIGMLCTAGFRDLVELGRGDRHDPYDLFSQRPAPLVPRRLRMPVRERLRADGSVEISLERGDVAEAKEAFDAAGVEAVAVCFLHAYANPQHELAAEAALRELGFAGEITLSHRVSGEYREYERTSTAVIDAYVRPRMVGYLKRLGDSLRQASFAGEPLVTRSGGGAITFAEAAERPFETVMSGPVAGAEGAAELARELGLDDLITADVGGTSFDTCVIRAGRPNVLHEGSVGGFTLQTTWVDVRSIGSGGGSIAAVDAGGLLRVGPQSAGADPGPACYGKGGEQPTVSDAAFLLGMLGPGRLSSGILLDRSLAETAMTAVAEPLGLELEEAAVGILRIATASMAEAIRSITIEEGRDPRDAVLMPFGGAGPLFACLLARELEIARIVIPPYAGNFSAWGLLGAELTQSAARTKVMPLGDSGLEVVGRLLSELFGEIADRRSGETPTEELSREALLDMRYAGQEHTLSVPLPLSGEAPAIEVEELRRAFERQYDATFGSVMDEEIEIVATRATLRRPLDRRGHTALPVASSSFGEEVVRAWSFAESRWLEFAVVPREALGADGVVTGPAILVEPTATLYLDADWRARVEPRSRALIVETVEEKA